MERSLKFGCVAALLVFQAETVLAHAVSQKVGVYKDNRGYDKQRVDFGLNLNLKHKGSKVSESTVNLTLGFDESDALPTGEEEAEGFPTETVSTGDVSLNLSQTWGKLTNTRQSIGQTRVDGKTSPSYGVGFSRWFFKEHLQASLDLFKNSSTRDVIEVLDQDSEVISPPKYYHSEGAVLSFRHLVSPKTIMNYGVAQARSNDRPDLQSVTVGVKQFLANPWSSKYHAAIHADLVRVDNSGELTNRTSVGELEGWIGQVSWLQQLGKNWRTKVAYRQYQEDETTRVNQDQYFLGTDLVSGTVVWDIEKKDLANIDFPLSLEATYRQYNTNEINDEGDKIAANIYEFGANAKF